MKKICRENWNYKESENEICDPETAVKCPVCGRLVDDYDICVCGWQNTGPLNYDGGPNRMTLKEAQEAYKKGLPLR